MPKMKTRRAAAKRILEKKSPKRKRNMRKAALVVASDYQRVKDMLPYA